jgi:hypothetical protein
MFNTYNERDPPNNHLLTIKSLFLNPARSIIAENVVSLLDSLLSTVKPPLPPAGALPLPFTPA